MTTDIVRVAVDQDSLQVNPGEQVETVITVQNLGVAVGVFSIEVEGLDPSWYWLSSSSISPHTSEPFERFNPREQHPDDHQKHDQNENPCQYCLRPDPTWDG